MSRIKNRVNNILKVLKGRKNMIVLANIGLLFIFSIFTLNPHIVIAQDQFNSQKEALYVKGEDGKVVKRIKALVTAYSSTQDQTDDTPFITASGKTVKNGIVANNMLPFGTKIKIPQLYGDQVFVVQDRMHRRKSNNHFDVWMPERSLAVSFGVKITEIEVLE